MCNGKPPPVENASPVVESREHGRVIWYKCDEGYAKERGGNVICQYGKWEGPTPVCADRKYMRRVENIFYLVYVPIWTNLFFSS